MGHILSEEGIQIDLQKIQSILKAKSPVNLKENGRVAGQVKWHNTCLRYLLDVCAPLSHLIKKGMDFVWFAAQEKAFQIFKK